MHRSQIQLAPRSLTCSDHVAGRSSTEVPQTAHVQGSLTGSVWLASRALDPGRTLRSVEEPDPHYLELLRSSKLPQAYLPAAMPGPQKPWVRAAATVVIGILMFATVLGICLTYGPGA